MGIPKDLLEILACPKCRGGLELSAGEDRLICRACRLAYPITKEGIPVMLIDEALPLEGKDA